MGKVLDRLRAQGYEKLHWSGRDGTFDDLSPNKNNLTPAGVPLPALVKTENGMSGLFQGTGGVALGESILTTTSAINFTDQTKFSILAWVRWNKTASGYYTIANVGAARVSVAIVLAGGFATFQVLTNNDAWQSSAAGYNSSKLRCVHWVFDAGDYLYVDSLLDVFRADNAPTAANLVMNIGAIVAGQSGFSGFIDTVIVHVGYAPNASEVSAMYGETHPRGVP